MPDTTVPQPSAVAPRRGAGQRRPSTLGDSARFSRAALDALGKLGPRRLVRNPVIFATEVVSVLVTALAVEAALAGGPWAFQGGIALWLWLTVLFATFAEAVAEGRGRAQAESL